MLTKMEYMKQSIETNLFFLRIMKEHIIFAGAGLTLRDADMVPELMRIKGQFEKILAETVTLSANIISPRAMAAGDIITEHTYRAESVTSQLTGLPIDTGITLMEIRLLNNPAVSETMGDEQAVSILNQRIMTLLELLIKEKKKLLGNILRCKMFTGVYPLMLDHVTREAEHYMEQLVKLQRRENTDQPLTRARGEDFWNDIMGEHARFIRGLLDPTEEELIRTANGFANEFDGLTIAAKQACDQLELLPGVTRKSLEAAVSLGRFKEQITRGILECNIRSVILPLLSDHVLREANHYLKHLRAYVHMRPDIV